MGRSILLAGLVAALALFVVGVSVTGAEKEQDQAMEKGHAGMKEMCMSENMVMCRKMLMGMTVKPADPQAMLALKDELKLTDAQVSKLKEIAEKARTDAKKVLDETQSAELAKLADTPESFGGMCKMMGDEGKPCPMMTNKDMTQSCSMTKGEGEAGGSTMKHEHGSMTKDETKKEGEKAGSMMKHE